jgi:RNA polymerase sigma-70 factor (sigma-E family)
MREPEGFTDFVVRQQAALQRTAFLLTGDWQLAEDLVQATLAKAWVHWARVIRAGQPDAYVRRMIVTTYVTWWRRRWRREFTAEAFPDIPASADQVAETTDRMVARGLLARLPARQRAVLVLRYYEDMTEKEVAAMMGCTVGTVKSQTAKALSKLRVDADLCAWPGQAGRVPADRAPADRAPDDQAAADAGPGRAR